MSKIGKNGSVEDFTIVFEDMDVLDSHISQAEISLVKYFFDGIYDDLVRLKRQKKEDEQ